MQRIDERVRAMFEKGFVEEVRSLIGKGVPPTAKPMGAIGYRHILENSESGNTWDETIGMIQRDTRRYAKRQMTWFRKLPRTMWFDGFGDNPEIRKRSVDGFNFCFPVGPSGQRPFKEICNGEPSCLFKAFRMCISTQCVATKYWSRYFCSAESG